MAQSTDTNGTKEEKPFVPFTKLQLQAFLQRIERGERLPPVLVERITKTALYYIDYLEYAQ